MLRANIVQSGQFIISRICFLTITRQIISPRSIFSFFRRVMPHKNEGEDKKPETSDIETIWTKAKMDLLNHEIIKVLPEKDKSLLKRSQIRKIKKSAFMDVIALFLKRSGTSRRGFNEFIHAALERMPEYDVADDYEAYKTLFKVFPSNRLKPLNFYHAEFFAYKEQQDTAVRLLLQICQHGLMMDDEMGELIVNIFGYRSYVMTHYRRIMYWNPKMRHMNPWPVLEILPDDLEDNSSMLARLIAARICPDRLTKFTTVEIGANRRQASQPCCLVSAQSPTQRALLTAYTSTTPDSLIQPALLHLEGPHFVWFNKLIASYYVLWAPLNEKRLQHQLALKEESAEKLSTLDDASWNFRVCGSTRDKWIPMQRITESFNYSEISDLPVLQIKERRLVESSTNDRKRALWSALQIGHSLSFVPNELTRHEQAECTILALGVVGPVDNALKDQQARFDWEATKFNKEPNQQLDSNFVSTSPDKLVVPAHAPVVLLRMWLNELRVKNPSMDRATVIMHDESSSTLFEEHGEVESAKG